MIKTNYYNCSLHIKLKKTDYKMSKLGNFQKSIDAISFKPERAGIIQELQRNFTLTLRI